MIKTSMIHKSNKHCYGPYMVMLLAQCIINQNDVYIIHPIDLVILKFIKDIWLTETCFFSSKSHFECIAHFNVNVTYLAGSSDTDFDANENDKVGCDLIHSHSHIHTHTYVHKTCLYTLYIYI